MKKPSNAEGKYLVAVRIEEKNELFAFKRKADRDSFIEEVKARRCDYATATLNEK